jgi:hypothetical protein
VRRPLVIFVLTQQVPPILAIALGIVVYLTVIELLDEDDLQLLWKAFWVLFVFLGHVLGYGIFRAWLALHRRGRDASAQP